jgi:hypothetical protein
MPTFRVTGGALTLDSVGLNYPDNELPGSPPGIDNSLPIPPPPLGVWPPPVPAHPIVPAPPGTPPGAIWPSPGYPSHQPVPPSPGAPPGRPDQGLPATPGVPTHPIASQTFWMLCYSPRLGWKYVTVDPSLKPDNTLPPHAQPK